NPIVRYDNFTIAGPAYLGPACEPFAVTGDPSAPNFKVPNIGLENRHEAQRLGARMSLKKQFDCLRRDLDSSGALRAMDQFEAQAGGLWARPEAARGFGLDLEDPRPRGPFGRQPGGQEWPLARRPGGGGVGNGHPPLGGSLWCRVGNWDDHAVNHHVFD